MENAAKALSMAASVIIGVLLVALLLYAYNRFVQVPQQEEQVKKTQQMAEFNKKYESYNQKNLKGNKFRSLLNMVLDNNKRYENVAEYQIHIKLDGNPQNYEEIYNGKGEDEKNNLRNKTYTCLDVKYNRTRWTNKRNDF